mmetsp:Transcript_40926/g.80756  ORF Transcript_40926/g.80756 Transcript_40926/m.80756 type:complete len:202 (+) Transcript_40926:45-650(+)
MHSRPDRRGRPCFEGLLICGAGVAGPSHAVFRPGRSIAAAGAAAAAAAAEAFAVAGDIIVALLRQRLRASGPPVTERGCGLFRNLVIKEPWRDARGTTNLSSMGDCLDHDFQPGHGEVHESIHVIGAIRCWCGLRSDATASTRNDVWRWPQEVSLLHVMHLLLVAVARDYQVNAILLCQPGPITMPMLRREVCHNDLPLRI